jgi:TolA-binding protein
VSGGREPEALVRALAEERIPSEEPEAQAARRERLVPIVALQIRQANEQRDRRARMARYGKVALAAASIVLALGVGYRVQQSEVRSDPAVHSSASHVAAAVRDVKGTLVVTHAGRARVVSPSEVAELSLGDELSTAADGHALLKTERSAIKVEPATQLSMAHGPLEERIHLSVGRVELKVQKQPHSNRSVVVETPNAEVVVRGTMFSVSVDSEQDVPVTHVRVTEGSVWILHDGKRDLVSVGNEWTSNRSRNEATEAPAPARAPTPEGVVSAPAAVSAPPTTARNSAATSAAARTASGSLGEENRMFQAAVDARNHGDDARALELFGALLARYPNGRLSEEARVERMRALRRVGNAAGAASEARRYLAEHPHGYAQDEARGDALGK